MLVSETIPTCLPFATNLVLLAQSKNNLCAYQLLLGKLTKAIIWEWVLFLQLKNPGCKQRLTSALRAQSGPAPAAAKSDHFV